MKYIAAFEVGVSA